MFKEMYQLKSAQTRKWGTFYVNAFLW